MEMIDDSKGSLWREAPSEKMRSQISSLSPSPFCRLSTAYTNTGATHTSSAQPNFSSLSLPFHLHGGSERCREEKVQSKRKPKKNSR